MKDMILDAYAQALLAAMEKGILGERAKVAARNATAHVVSRELGKPVTPEMVKEIVTKA